MFRLNVICHTKLLTSIKLTSWINYPTFVVHELRTSDRRRRPTFEAVEIITVAFRENSKLRSTESYAIVYASLSQSLRHVKCSRMLNNHNIDTLSSQKLFKQVSRKENYFVAVTSNFCLTTKSFCIEFQSLVDSINKDTYDIVRGREQ